LTGNEVPSNNGRPYRNHNIGISGAKSMSRMTTSIRELNEARDELKIKR
jgi:hypothetical protein